MLKKTILQKLPLIRNNLHKNVYNIKHLFCPLPEFIRLTSTVPLSRADTAGFIALETLDAPKRWNPPPASEPGSEVKDKSESEKPGGGARRGGDSSERGEGQIDREGVAEEGGGGTPS